jgi:hypothetical protein
VWWVVGEGGWSGHPRQPAAAAGWWAGGCRQSVLAAAAGGWVGGWVARGQPAPSVRAIHAVPRRHRSRAASTPGTRQRTRAPRAACPPLQRVGSAGAAAGARFPLIPPFCVQQPTCTDDGSQETEWWAPGPCLPACDVWLLLAGAGGPCSELQPGGRPALHCLGGSGSLLQWQRCCMCPQALHCLGGSGSLLQWQRCCMCPLGTCQIATAHAHAVAAAACVCLPQ